VSAVRGVNRRVSIAVIAQGLVDHLRFLQELFSNNFRVIVPFNSDFYVSSRITLTRLVTPDGRLYGYACMH